MGVAPPASSPSPKATARLDPAIGQVHSATPAPAPPTSSLTAPALRLEKKLLIQFLASEAFMKKFEKSRALLSNRLSETSYEKIIETMMDEFLERHSSESKIARREKRLAKNAAAGGVDGAPAPRPACEHGRGNRRQDPRRANQNAAQSEQASKAEGRRLPADHSTPRSARPLSRHIPAPIRGRVFARDKGRCTYVSPGGKRCGATHHLQIDHIVPFGRGGSSTEGNLRLLCGKHNRLEAERVYGPDVTARHRPRE